MSKDKVISMEDFKQTERELAEGTYDGVQGYTKVLVASHDGTIITIVEQGVEGEQGEDQAYSGIAMDYDELLAVMEQLELCKEKMEQINNGEIV